MKFCKANDLLIPTFDVSKQSNDQKEVKKKLPFYTHVIMIYQFSELLFQKESFCF